MSLHHDDGSDGCSNVGKNRQAELQKSSILLDHGGGSERHSKLGKV